MKKLLVAALLTFCHCVSAQIRIELPESVADKSFVTSLIKAAEARQKAYVDSLFKVKGNGGGDTRNPGNGLDSCKRGPIPNDVYNITQSGATVLFDGDGVFGWDFSIIQNGIVKVTGNSGNDPLQKNTVPISYSLAPGEYQIALKGNTCLSKVYTRTFVVPKPTGDNSNGSDGGNSGPPPVSNGKRSLGMNLTGYGFDVNAPTGINKDWLPRIEAFLNLKYNGKTFRGIDFIRVNIKWYSYQPNEKTFRDDKILDLINYCKARGLKLCVTIIPWRLVGDGMLERSEWLEHLPDPKWRPSAENPIQDLVWHDTGDLPSTEKTYMPSLHSKAGQEKFRNAVRHLAEFMAKYPEYVDYISTATSPGEEYETVIHRANGQILLTGYNQTELSAWRDYSGGAAVPYPSEHTEQGIANLFGSEEGKKWYEFRTRGLKDFHAAFVRGVREGGKGKVRSQGMYAGVGAPSGTWTGLYKLNDIFSAGTSDQPDIIYSSEGDAGSQGSKLMATDLNMGTFPGASLAIEFDPNDLSVDQDWQTSKDEDVNGDILYYWAAPFYRRGGEQVHFAMSFTEWKIPDQLGPAVYKLRSEFIDSDKGMTGIAQGDHFTFPVTRYNGLLEYRGMYSERGGGVNKVVKIKLTGASVGTSPEGNDGGVPAPQPSKDYSPVKSYLEGNISGYNWNIIFDLRAPSGELYSFTTGGNNKDSRLSVMSHSKFTTGVIIAYLIDQGKLSFDTRVGDVIRSWNRSDRAGITVRQIMGHLSGIPDNTDNEGAETLEYYVDQLVNKPGFTTPGERFIYSTSAYQVVARMAEIVSGKAWKDLFRDILVNPCEMGSAEYNPTIGDIKGKPLNPRAGYGLFCSENEWMNFISMIRDGGIFKGRRVLSENVFTILKTQTSPGWSDWGCGVMFRDGQFISEAASGCFTFILPGKYTGTIFTQSSYEPTYNSNHWVRLKVNEIYNQ